ncbi:hypothetical protein Lser_V15G38175 [Lactuca serriola]
MILTPSADLPSSTTRQSFCSFLLNSIHPSSDTLHFEISDNMLFCFDHLGFVVSHLPFSLLSVSIFEDKQKKLLVSEKLVSQLTRHFIPANEVLEDIETITIG